VAGFLGNPPMNILSGRLAKSEGGWHWEGAFGLLKLPEQLAMTLAGCEGRVQWGARPEAIQWSLGEVPANAWKAEVRLVEWFGDSQLVTLLPLGGSFDGPMVVARLPVTMKCCVGEPGGWWVEQSDWHWFDEATGQSLPQNARLDRSR
jgi:ABC-type sugar transport system ATPase subunit